MSLNLEEIFNNHCNAQSRVKHKSNNFNQTLDNFYKENFKSNFEFFSNNPQKKDFIFMVVLLLTMILDFFSI